MFKFNIEDGPNLKPFYTCEKCKYLVESVFNVFGNTPYSCSHDKIKLKDNIIRGQICKFKITPEFCPFLIKKIRKDKLEKIESSK